MEARAYTTVTITKKELLEFLREKLEKEHPEWFREGEWITHANYYSGYVELYIQKGLPDA